MECIESLNPCMLERPCHSQLACLRASTTPRLQSFRLQTPLFAYLQQVAVAAAASLLPSKGYKQLSDNPCTQLVLRRPLDQSVLRQLQEDQARLRGEGFVLSLLRSSDAELVNSLWWVCTSVWEGWGRGVVRDACVVYVGWKCWLLASHVSGVLVCHCPPSRQLPPADVAALAASMPSTAHFY